MNLKKAKQLRKAVRDSSAPGELLRQLVGFRQICAPRIHPETGKTYTPQTICAINNPWSVRGRYRALKKGRVVDLTRVADDNPRQLATAMHEARKETPQILKPVKKIVGAKLKNFFRRHQAR